MELNPPSRLNMPNNEFKGYDLNGNLRYKTEEILSKCQLKSDSEFVYYVALMLNEPRTDLIIELYKELGKDFLISIIEKTLTIENEGGLMKQSGTQSQSKEKKTVGGVFFFLIKKNEGSKDIAKKVFKINYQQRNERKRTYRKLEQMQLK